MAPRFYARENADASRFVQEHRRAGKGRSVMLPLAHILHGHAVS
jgi:hypothetical protein